MSVLQPKIDSIVNGTLTITVDSPTEVAAVFDQLLLFESTASVGPFTQIATIALTGAESYTILDTDSLPTNYYKAQFFNSSTLVSSIFSELAQETSIYENYALPYASPSYPPEIALSVQDREIVESIRVTLGDLGQIERDYFNSADPQSVYACSASISDDQCTWELAEYKGWPQTVKLNGSVKTSITDPLVIGYRFLTFSGSTPCITGTLDIIYDHFRFSDREILLAYDRSINLLVSCGLPTTSITTEMRIMQAAILLLEGELRDTSQQGIRVRDGDTEFDNTNVIRSRTEDLSDLKQKIKDLIDCARYNLSYSLEGVRID